MTRALTPTEATVFDAIKDGITAKEVCAAIDGNKNTVGRCIAVLQHRGLITSSLAGHSSLHPCTKVYRRAAQ